MSAPHSHEHHDHHGHDHAHDHTPSATDAAPVTRSVKGAWEQLVKDTKARLHDGVNPYAKAHDHGTCAHGHDHAMEDALAARVGTVDKVGIVAGASVSLGVALHGLNNVKRGMVGFKDKELNEERGPSLQYLLVGAAETAAGLAMAKRVLSGSWQLFPGK